MGPCATRGESIRLRREAKCLSSSEKGEQVRGALEQSVEQNQRAASDSVSGNLVPSKVIYPDDDYAALARVPTRAHRPHKSRSPCESRGLMTGGLGSKMYHSRYPQRRGAIGSWVYRLHGSAADRSWLRCALD